MNRPTLLLTLFSFLTLSGQASAFFIQSTLKIETPAVQEEINLFALDINLGLAGLPANTSSLVNSLFFDLTLAEAQIKNEIQSELLSLPEISSINYVIVDALPLSVDLRQQNNSLIATVSGLSLSVSGNSSSGIPVICSNPAFHMSLSDISVSIQYNIYTGALQLSDVDYNLSTDASCGGLLGFLGDIFAGPIFQSYAESAIESALLDAANAVDMIQLFSIHELADKVLDADPVTNLPTAIEQALINIRGLLASTNLNSGLRIGIDMEQRIESQYEGGFVLNFIYNTLTLSTNF